MFDLAKIVSEELLNAELVAPWFPVFFPVKEKNSVSFK